MSDLSDLIKRGEFDQIVEQFPTFDDTLVSPDWAGLGEQAQIDLYDFYSKREESSEYSSDANPIVDYKPNRHLDKISELAGHIIGIE
jgi:hypothetical protein